MTLSLKSAYGFRLSCPVLFHGHCERSEAPKEPLSGNPVASGDCFVPTKVGTRNDNLRSGFDPIALPPGWKRSDSWRPNTSRKTLRFLSGWNTNLSLASANYPLRRAPDFNRAQIGAARYVLTLSAYHISLRCRQDGSPPRRTIPGGQNFYHISSGSLRTNTWVSRLQPMGPQ